MIPPRVTQMLQAFGTGTSVGLNLIISAPTVAASASCLRKSRSRSDVESLVGYHTHHHRLMSLSLPCWRLLTVFLEAPSHAKPWASIRGRPLADLRGPIPLPIAQSQRCQARTIASAPLLARFGLLLRESNWTGAPRFCRLRFQLVSARAKRGR